MSYQKGALFGLYYSEVTPLFLKHCGIGYLKNETAP